MIYLSLADLAKIRRRQEIHAAELVADGLVNVEYDNEEEQNKARGDENGSDDDI